MKSKIVALLIWTLFVSTLVFAQEAAAPAAAPAAPAMPLVETDTESGAQIYLLGGDERDANTIYGEQPYGDSTGRWIVIGYGDHLDKNKKGGKGRGLSVIDLTDGSRRDLIVGYGHAAGHAWGEYVYFQQMVEGKRMLRRCRFETLKQEDVAPIPNDLGLSWVGAVSPDRRYFVTEGTDRKKTPPVAKVHLLDLESGKWSLLLEKPGYLACHEQFSRDGRNRVLVQLNGAPQVLLAELEIGGKERLFPVGHPYTPRVTGHEAWIGTSDRIFISTDKDVDDKSGNIGKVWTAKVGEDKATLIAARPGPGWFYHISVSRCGRYWIADTCGGAEGRPIYIGSFASGKWKHAFFTRSGFPITGGSFPITGDRGHPHPYMTADNKWVIFTSQREKGHTQVYGAKLAEGWLAGL